MFDKLRDWYEMRQVAAHRRRTAAAIDKHGWTANYVGDERGQDVDFAYTIGFSDFGAPELLVFDLDPHWVNHVFWEAFDLVKQGRGLADGQVYRCSDPEAQGFECTFRDASHPDVWRRYVFDSIAYSQSKGRGNRPAVMQVVWPSSKNGLYPWDDGCPREVIAAQPRLY